MLKRDQLLLRSLLITMKDRFDTESRILKKFDRSNLRQLVADLGRHLQEIKENAARVENKKLREMLKTAQENAEHLPQELHYREVPYDPAIDADMRARSDDPYVMALDAATVPARDNDDLVALEYLQPSEPRGSPCDPQTMPPKAMSQDAIERLITQRVNTALTIDHATRNTTGGSRGNVGAVKLCKWFEKTDSVFSISEYAKRNKVNFATATLHGRALTWWNSQVATLRLETANGMHWTELKIMMKKEFCLTKEIQRMEKNKKVEAYIRGLSENVKGEMTSSKPVTLKEAVRMAHILMEQKLQAKNERVAEGNKRRWENS
nr:hypothetical protein [Tanacetum cinerariifolium]